MARYFIDFYLEVTIPVWLYTSAFIQCSGITGLSSYVGSSNDGIIRTAADLQGQGLLNGELPTSVLFIVWQSWILLQRSAAKQEKILNQPSKPQDRQIWFCEVSFGFEFEQRQDYY